MIENDLSSGLLIVLGTLAGLAGLLILLTVLEPTKMRRPAGAHRSTPTREKL